MSQLIEIRDFPAFLYRDNLRQVEACGEISACAGVAWAAFKLCVRSLLVMLQLAALYGFACFMRRLLAMPAHKARAVAGFASMVAATVSFSAIFWITGTII